MSRNADYWEQFLRHVDKTLEDFGEKTPVVLTFGLASEITEVFDITQKEIIKGKSMSKERIYELGDVLWYIAAIEIYYNLPRPRYTNYLGIPFEINNAHEINLVRTHSEAMYLASEISRTIVTGEADDIQYNLNKMFAIIIDICTVYGISVVDCLEACVSKLKKRYPKGFDKNAEKNYENEYAADRQSIVEEGEEEVLLSLIIDKRLKNPYKEIEVSGYNEKHKFNTGDIIVDFFNASNFVANTYADKSYRINYSPKFRQLLNKTVDTLFTGYIIGEELVPAAEVRKRMNSKGTTVNLGRKGRPVLMTPNFKTPNDLYDYINEQKNSK